MLTERKERTMIDFEFEFQYAEAKLPSLRQISGSVPAGRCVVLCGGSGCGKSTLLRCINGLIPQFYEGELKGFCRLNGKDTAGLSIGEIGELVASVFQDTRSQFFTVNSSNEVAFGLENHGLPQEEILRRVDEAFRVFHLDRLKDRNVYELSSGERQLISILSAWAMDTDIFLLDEPTANLDFAATQQLREILLALKQQGKTLLLSEHRLYYLTDIADEYWVMADGEIKGKYTAAEAKALSTEQRQALSLRTLDLAEITVPEKTPLPKTAPTVLDVSDVRYTYGRKAGVALSHVDFSYDSKPILRDVSLTIPEKTTVAIVGPSGSGKTTLCNLMARFWDVQSGSVSLGGRDVREYSYDSLIRNFSFVFQRVYLFSDTIANNIRFGRPDASTEEVMAAAKKARCYDFIMALPDGFDTVIGEGGATLSGGERQRISIARAIMKDAPIIILDEATANVDPENEKELMEAVSELTQDKTVIMIAHRLKTVRNADQIFVVDKGQIVQHGTHDELVAVDGLYRRFVVERQQAAGWKV